MIFNLPHQSAASLERDVRILMEEIQIDQVTFYPLMPSVATRETMARQMGQSGFEREKQLYHLILDSMPAAYRPSSAWCFSRAEAAMIDEYIVDHQEYAGVGSGAFGYLNGTTYANTFSIDRYIDEIGRGRTAITAQRRHSRYEQMQYEFVMGLFGLSLDGAVMKARYGEGYVRTLWKEFLAFRLLGAIKKEGGRYRLTRRGMYYWVIMMREFFIGVNNFRDQMRAQVDVEPCVDVEGQKKMAPTL
jgi:coproporphyrinogen III oxidase-like Fe-S oxidoreductase